MKKNLAKTFRHMSMIEIDWWFLNFFWENHYYYDRFLFFDLRISFYIFDLLIKIVEQTWMIVIALLLNYVQKQVRRFIKRHKIVRYQDTSFNTIRSRLNFLEISLKFDLVLSHFSTLSLDDDEILVYFHRFNFYLIWVNQLSLTLDFFNLNNLTKFLYFFLKSDFVKSFAIMFAIER